MNVLIILLSLLIAVPVHAMQMIGFGGGPTCSSQSAAVTQSTGGGLHCVWQSYPVDENTRGQSFTVPDNVTLYSIVVTGSGATAGASCNINMRVSLYPDLRTSYLAAAVPLTCGDDTPVDYEFIFQSKPSLFSGTTYYWGIVTDAVVNDNAFCFDRSTSDVYANGSEWVATAVVWYLDGYLPTRDAVFTIKKCD